MTTPLTSMVYMTNLPLDANKDVLYEILKFYGFKPKSITLNETTYGGITMCVGTGTLKFNKDEEADSLIKFNEAIRYICPSVEQIIDDKFYKKKKEKPKKFIPEIDYEAPTIGFSPMVDDFVERALKVINVPNYFTEKSLENIFKKFDVGKVNIIRHNNSDMSNAFVEFYTKEDCEHALLWYNEGIKIDDDHVMKLISMKQVREFQENKKQTK